MARRKSRPSRQVTRDAFVIANDPLRDLVLAELEGSPLLSDRRSGLFDAWASPLADSILEDRRLFYPSRNPMDFLPARTNGAVLARLSAPAPIRREASALPDIDPPKGVFFDRPGRQVTICARRIVRREVLHARGRAGSKVRRPGRRGPYTNVFCKR